VDLVRRLENHSIILVFCCTILGAGAQVLFKLAAKQMPAPGFWNMVTNVPLIGGYALYAVNTAMLTLALRKGQLSLLYPVISLTYVWVAILSVLVFGESINGLEGLGLGTVVAGVALLGLDGRRA
jgi:multidrug transporter EmrE-like cation transporter